MVRTAIIVAAGLGVRIKEKSQYYPKGFIQVGHLSLIERSITNLFDRGIEKIYIGTGYLNHFYDELREKYSRVQTVYSSRCATTSSMETLYQVSKFIREDVILLESDLLYEYRALDELINDDKQDLILASSTTNSGDEVYIQVNENKDLIKINKDLQKIDKVYGELVGISKISIERLHQMCKIYKQLNNPKIDYEMIMCECSKIIAYPVKRIENLVWCEVDNLKHLQRAVDVILPKIEANTN